MVHSNNRKEERFYLPGLKAKINVTDTSTIGTINDISSFGLRICNINREKLLASHRYNIGVTGYEYKIFFIAKPCWISSDDSGNILTIGFKILHPPQMWKILFQRINPNKTQNTPTEIAYYKTEESITPMHKHSSN